MRRLQFQYHMQLTFDTPIHDHYFTLRCTPVNDARQRVLSEKVEIYPKHYSSEEPDSYGNKCIYGVEKKEHDHFSVDVSGEVEVHEECRIPAPPAHCIGMYRYRTPLTTAGETIEKFYRGIIGSFPADPTGKEAEDPLPRVSYMMDKLYQHFQYKPGTTSVSTTAEEAFEKGGGVCQDYAHILLALCRIEQIPCRYVAGMLLGEGETHAWIEVSDGQHWIPLDPTHNRPVDDTYIKISCGRDAQDCTLNQGVFIGGGTQRQTIRVVVCEVV